MSPMIIYTDSGVPDEYLCPITREIMKDPVICSGKPLPEKVLQYMVCDCIVLSNLLTVHFVLVIVCM